LGELIREVKFPDGVAVYTNKEEQAEEKKLVRSAA
jgi:hypothetical protein